MGNQQLKKQNTLRLQAAIVVATSLFLFGTGVVVANTADTVKVSELRLEAVEHATQLVIEADQALVWHPYRDADGRLVLDLPNTEIGEVRVPDELGLIENVQVEAVDNEERPMTRLYLTTAADAEAEIEAEGRQLRVSILPSGSSSPVVAKADAPTPAAEAASVVSHAAAPTVVAAAASGTADDPFIGPEPTGVTATRLDEVRIAHGDSGLEIELVGDGEFRYTSFSLESPPRFVVDLHGVVNLSSQGFLPSNHPALDAVRVAQFESKPEPISRVVLDLATPLFPSIARTSSQLKIGLVQDSPVLPVTVVPPATEMAQAEPESLPERSEAPDLRSQEMEAVSPVQVAQSPAPAPAPAATEEDLWEEELITAPVVTPASMEVAAIQPSDVELLEAASVPDDMGTMASQSATAGAYEAREVGNTGSKYVGAPITFSLRDADIREVLRTFAKLGGLNMVVQPGVSGSVTVELEQVPWDQALEQILKINNLGYELEGNIMRIAPRSMLAQEAAQEAERLRAIADSVPLKTVMKRISYSSAAEVAGLLGNSSARILSGRGSAAVDPRTNTVIIKELPDYMDAVLAVIDQIDVPEPQVMIEARIVETTKEYSRSLGVGWGFTQTADTVHGNTTGLTFPNEITSNGGVNLLTGGNNGFLNLSMANLLDTFTLDASLQAAEQEGLVNILSAPKIATLNNAPASIQSGIQIPIQTVSNNTISVQFVNATLKLDVTPHVTADGTVLMDIDVKKREPQLAFLVQGATNAPISTKEAKTRVIVRDGGTTVIGGIYKVTNDRGQDRVPGLANIPILGHLFKNRRDSNQNDELLIFITPRVIKL